MLSLLLAFAAVPLTVSADGGVAYTFEDLQSMLDEGGTVTLGASITVPEDETLSVEGASINTSGAGIRVEGFLELWDGAVITGEGVSKPVIEVTSSGGIGVHGYDYENAPRVTATGDGASAIYLSEESYGIHTNPGGFLRITASGADAVAIQSEESFNLVRNFIDAPNGVGILCPEDVSLFLCQINAGTAVDAPSFTADTCVLLPAGGDGGTFINRKVIQDSYVRVFVKQGEPIPEAEARYAEFPVTLRADGYPDDGTMLGATVKLPEADTNVTGIYPFGVTPDECWAAFDFLPEDVILIAAEVYDPELPYFSDAGYLMGAFYVEYLFDGGLSGLTLWRSDDGGESWYDYTGDSEMEYYPGDMISLPFYEQPAFPVWLVWEAEGIGESEILRLSWDGTFASDLGGDRGGVGRGGTDKPPTAALPTPTATPAPEPQASQKNKEEDSDRRPRPAYVAVMQVPAPISTPAPADVPYELSEPPVTEPELTTAPNKAADAESVTVSGERLAAMLETSGDSVPFFVEERRVSLPSDWLGGLDIDAADSFSVAIEQPDENGEDISVTVNGVEVTDKPEADVTGAKPGEAPLQMEIASADLFDGVTPEAPPVSVVENEPISIPPSEKSSAVLSVSGPKEFPLALPIGGVCLVGACTGAALIYLRKRR